MNDNRIKPEHRDRAKHLVKLIEVRYGTYFRRTFGEDLIESVIDAVCYAECWSNLALVGRLPHVSSAEHVADLMAHMVGLRLAIKELVGSDQS
jgi:hypothetical protein